MLRREPTFQANVTWKKRSGVIREMLTGVCTVEISCPRDLVTRMRHYLRPDESLKIENIQVRDHPALGDKPTSLSTLS